jgi:rare lipoprotein A
MQHRTYHHNWLSQYHLIFLFMVLCIISLLNGCSTVRKDGPPPYDVDVSNIPNAQPKVEKLSKYGNMPVYRVNGKNYYVMNNSKHYEAEGVASWYGTKFHRRNTSSGEKYDMLAMTAAHRTLPLPTYLEVTNKTNGRTVIVKVNDRGPFADNRLLDLSYAAAKKLGMIGHGTANVAVKAIDPIEYEHQHEEIHTNSFYIVRNQPSSSTMDNSPQLTENLINTSVTSLPTEKTHATFKAKQIAHYAKNNTVSKPATMLHNQVYLQVGAFSNKSYAEKLKKQLSPLVASSVKITEHGHPRKLYRVQIGPIKDKTTVAHINKQLKSIGLNGKMLFV